MFTRKPGHQISLLRSANFPVFGPDLARKVAGDIIQEIGVSSPDPEDVDTRVQSDLRRRRALVSALQRRLLEPADLIADVSGRFAKDLPHVAGRARHVDAIAVVLNLGSASELIRDYTEFLDTIAKAHGEGRRGRAGSNQAWASAVTRARHDYVAALLREADVPAGM